MGYPTACSCPMLPMLPMVRSVETTNSHTTHDIEQLKRSYSQLCILLLSFEPCGSSSGVASNVLSR